MAVVTINDVVPGKKYKVVSPKLSSDNIRHIDEYGNMVDENGDRQACAKDFHWVYENWAFEEIVERLRWEECEIGKLYTIVEASSYLRHFIGYKRRKVATNRSTDELGYTKCESCNETYKECRFTLVKETKEMFEEKFKVVVNQNGDVVSCPSNVEVVKIIQKRFKDLELGSKFSFGPAGNNKTKIKLLNGFYYLDTYQLHLCDNTYNPEVVVLQ